jgi:DNA polymerase
VSHSLANGKPYEYKCLTFDKERILLPSGLALKYPELTGHADEKGRIQWSYGADAKSIRKLYGGKIVENVVQAVARCVMTDGMLRIQKRYSCVLTVHDEVVCLVPEDEAVEAEAWVLEQMVKEPSYMPGIPLDAETGCNKRYGEAK